MNANTLLYFVIAIIVLVSVHEYGHFWVARRLGVKVLRFSIGFGRPLLRWHGRDADRVEYVLAAIPLGGYVKMLDESEGDVSSADADRAFNRQSLPVRTAIVAAGPIANFLFAIVAYAAMFMLGTSGLKPIVGAVTPDSIADAAGLRAGHQIVAVDGREVQTWQGTIEAFLRAPIGSGSARLTLVDESGVRLDRALDLSGMRIDDVTQGRLFDALGVEPAQAPAVISGTTPGDPAEQAGLRAGDHVVSANGADVIGWRDFVDVVQASPGEALILGVERSGERLTIEVVPLVREGPDGPYGQIGARPADASSLYAVERYGVLEAAERGAVRTWDTIVLTVRFLWKMVAGEASVKNLSGPISIAEYAGKSAEVGAAYFLHFLALVSISLGILNLLPVPLLDGGHLLYYLIEAFRGKPLSDEAQFIGQRLGIAFLVGLMGVAFYNDVTRLLG